MLSHAAGVSLLCNNCESETSHGAKNKILKTAAVALHLQPS